MKSRMKSILIGMALFWTALFGTAYAGSLVIKSGTDWRAIGPAGNNQGSSMASVGLSWEADNPGWNNSLVYDDSTGRACIACWGDAVIVPPENDPPVIWVNGNGETGDTPAYFRRIFIIPGAAVSGLLTGGVDDDAQIYINGHLVLDDQNGTANDFAVDVTSYLNSGENLIAIKAHDSFGWKEGIHLTLSVDYSDGLFSFTGFFPPVDNPPVLNKLKPGSAVPVKFSLAGDQGLSIMAPGYPKSAQIACSSFDPLRRGGSCSRLQQ